MIQYIDFYVTIIDNYGDIGFALNLALKMVSKNHNLNVRFFNDNEELFNKMIGDNKNNIKFYNLSDLNDYIPSKTIFTFFDYKLPSNYLKKGEIGKNIIQFGYFLLHKGIENLHLTNYELVGNKFIHFIPSLKENTGGVIIQNYINKNNKEKYLNYLKSKYNLNIEITYNLLNKKWISVFVYKDNLNEIIEVIQKRKNEIFFVFDSGKRIQEDNNIIYMPFFELLDYNDFLSLCDLNIVRGENSLCTSLSSGKPTLWDIYKENNKAHNEKIDDFLIFLEENKIQELQYSKILKNFNSIYKKEAFTDFLDNSNSYKHLFVNLGIYINNNCDLYNKLKKIF
ncbi:MAG: elongation factor P maturation arginine rhamnosyltransferase EarP [Candidatus Gracilibacteria bacterium]